MNDTEALEKEFYKEFKELIPRLGIYVSVNLWGQTVSLDGSRFSASELRAIAKLLDKYSIPDIVV